MLLYISCHKRLFPFKISILLPFIYESEGGHGYDWGIVEELKEVTEAHVRPSANPQESSNNIAHFYDGTSTSIFIITREGNKGDGYHH